VQDDRVSVTAHVPPPFPHPYVTFLSRASIVMHAEASNCHQGFDFHRHEEFVPVRRTTVQTTDDGPSYTKAESIEKG